MTHLALKSDLYATAKNIINQGKKVYLWTGYDDILYSDATIVEDMNTLSKVFKYDFDMGWPVIRVEPVGNVIYHAS